MTSMTEPRAEQRHRYAPLLVTFEQVDILKDSAPAVTFTGSWPLGPVEDALRRLLRAKLISHASVEQGPRSTWGRRRAGLVRISFGFDVTIIDDGRERTLVCQELMDEPRAWALGRELIRAGLVHDMKMLTSDSGPLVVVPFRG